jgi:hypothetical protein
MPLPGRDQTFAFEDCREVLKKLEREIDRYLEVVGRDEQEPEALLKLVDQLRDSAFNAAVTAWHLCELGVQRHDARAAPETGIHQP